MKYNNLVINSHFAVLFCCLALFAFWLARAIVVPCFLFPSQALNDDCFFVIICNLCIILDDFFTIMELISEHLQ